MSARRTTPPEWLLEGLIRAWRNEAWSGGVEFLHATARWVHGSEGAILECGTGVSSLLLGATAAAGRPIVCLEHESQWVEQLRGFALRRSGSGSMFAMRRLLGSASSTGIRSTMLRCPSDSVSRSAMGRRARRAGAGTASGP